MKKLCLIVATFMLVTFGVRDVVFGQSSTLPFSSAWSEGNAKSTYHKNNDTLATTPKPFREIIEDYQDGAKPEDSLAVSTGYYFMDITQKTEATTNWVPKYDVLVPVVSGDSFWYRVWSGPKQFKEGSYHVSTESSEGLRFFRNPAQNFDIPNQALDTVNSAVAGPIPLKFAFYFNGIRYDSFYVSAKGMIALTNRRYYYDNNGNRVAPSGNGNNGCYDPMSSDWWAGKMMVKGVEVEDRSHDATGGLTDPTPDNYGFRYVVCGGDISNGNGGIRNTNNTFSATTGRDASRPLYQNIEQFVEQVQGGAYIAPFYGNYYLPQWDSVRKVSDDFGQVWYRRSPGSDKLIIYYKNLTLRPGTYVIGDASTYTRYEIKELGRPYDVNNPNRPYDANQASGSCQVVLDRTDSSITFVYGDFMGSVEGINQSNVAIAAAGANTLLNSFMLVGVGGYARHQAYDSKTDTPNPDGAYDIRYAPWAAEYKQFTQQLYGNQSVWPVYSMGPQRAVVYQAGNMLTNYSVKFKQYKNSLKLTDIQYYVRSKTNKLPNGKPDTAYSVEIKPSEVQDKYDPFELLASDEILGSMQPVAIIQNLTNDKQGPGGVNFVKQDFQFQSRFMVKNLAYEEFIYNRAMKVSNMCIRQSELHDADPANKLTSVCAEDQNASIRYTVVQWDDVDKTEYTSSPILLGANYNGIPPYGFAQVKFAPFSPNENDKMFIGAMEAQAITEAKDPNTKEVIGDDWPFDDSSKVNFWVIKRLSSFKDYVDNKGFNTVNKLAVPSIEKWVRNSNAGPTVVGTNSYSTHPLPPLGIARAANDTISGGYLSPFIQMKRDATNGTLDKLTSFPIDLRSQTGSVLTLSVQRNAANIDTRRGFSDATLIGPEPRVTFKNDLMTPYRGGYGGNRPTPTMYPGFDYIAVEFLQPSPDGIRNITNTGKGTSEEDIKNIALWQTKKTWPFVQSAPQYDGPALAIYGSGGYYLGWYYNKNLKKYAPVHFTKSYDNPNSLLDTIKGANNEVVAGIMYNPYDNGFDYEFYKYSVPIPDWYITGAFDGGKNFRFRIRLVDDQDVDESKPNYSDQDNVSSGDNQANDKAPSDDNDRFFVDNVVLITPDMTPDIEMAAVKVIWPYTKIPASQANAIDVYTRFTNVSTRDANAFTVKVKIFQGSIGNGDNPVYCRTMQQASLKAGGSVETLFPQFSARQFIDSKDGTGGATFVLQAISLCDADSVKKNDTVMSTFTVTFGDEIAYNASNVNDVQTETGINGKGLNLLGASYSGYNSDTLQTGTASSKYSYFAVQSIPWTVLVAGGSLHQAFPKIQPGGGSLAGQIAVRFELTNSDSLRGIRAMFGSANQAYDDISFDVYADANGSPAGKSGKLSKTLYAKRLLAVNANGVESDVPVVNDYVLYEFSKPIYLEKGAYWISIAQRGETGLELVATGENMAMRTTSVGVVGEADGSATIGRLTNGIQLMINKNFRIPAKHERYGSIYVNNNLFAYQNGIDEGVWQPFMPTEGDVAYAHLDLQGRTSAGFSTFTRGTWMPLLKPYFGPRTSVADTNRNKSCPGDSDGSGSDTTPVPVTIVEISGVARNNGVELMWETASETNNAGFIIERSNVGPELADINAVALESWQALGFVQGSGNSQTAIRYSYTDNNVVKGNTYLYRLKQQDIDGTEACPTYVVSVEYNNDRTLELGQNTPNPFYEVTNIKLYMPTSEFARLEVVDIFGKVVRTILADQLVSMGDATYSWNGRDEAGNKVATGSYLVRLTVGDNILSKKISFIRNN